MPNESTIGNESTIPARRAGGRLALSKKGGGKGKKGGKGAGKGGKGTGKGDNEGLGPPASGPTKSELQKAKEDRAVVPLLFDQTEVSTVIESCCGSIGW